MSGNRKNRRLLIFLFTILPATILAASNLAGNALWPGEANPPLEDGPVSVPTVPEGLDLRPGPTVVLSGFSLNFPLSIEGYALSAAYPEGLSLNYQGEAGAEFLAQVLDPSLTERLAFVADFPLSLMLESKKAPAYLAAAARCGPAYRWTWNPWKALRAPFLMRIKNLLTTGPAGSRFSGITSQISGGEGTIWRIFVAPENPNRFYGVTKFDGRRAVDMNLVFYKHPMNAAGIAAAMVEGLRLGGDAAMPEEQVSCTQGHATALCQVFWVVRLLAVPSDLGCAGRLLESYRRAGDKRGGRALLDFFRDRRPRNREIREFCESVERAFPVD